MDYKILAESFEPPVDDVTGIEERIWGGNGVEENFSSCEEFVKYMLDNFPCHDDNPRPHLEQDICDECWMGGHHYFVAYCDGMDDSIYVLERV